MECHGVPSQHTAMPTPSEQFYQIIFEHGLRPEKIIDDGKDHRCPTQDKPQSQNGWYCFYNDGHGFYKNWALDTEVFVFSQNGKSYEKPRDPAPPPDKLHAIWKAAVALKDHPYLKKKHITCQCEITKLKDYKGSLTVPLYNTQHQLQSLQFIDKDGGKKFLKGYPTKGGHYILGPSNELDMILVCEGIATGLSLHEALQKQVYVVFNAGNLEPVVKYLLETTQQNILICADNDQWNPKNIGVIKAQKAAALSRKRINYVLPHFKQLDSHPTDFNDLHVLEGLKAVQEQVLKVLDKAEAKQKLTRAEKAIHDEALVGSLFDLHLNEMDDYIYLHGKPVGSNELAVIRHTAIRSGAYCDAGRLDDIIHYLAAKQKFHPVKQFLTQGKWNHQENIKKLASYFDDEDNYFELFIRKWLIGAIERIFTGEFNPVLLLLGRQNMGKSRFSGWICPLEGYFVSSSIDPRDNDCRIRLIRNIVWEIDEIKSTTSYYDNDALKGFLSQKDITVRVPYGRVDIKKPALASFLGTSNEDGAGFLADTTGNRRYRVVYLKAVDWEGYTQNVDCQQLWFEAYYYYQQGERNTIDDIVNFQMTNKMEERCELVDPMEEYIHSYFEFTDSEDDKIQSTEILNIIIYHGWKGRVTTGEGRHLATCLKRLGVYRKKSNGILWYHGIKYAPKFLHHDQWYIKNY